MFYGNDYNFVMLLTAAEILSMSFSLFTGFAADLIGRRRLLLLGYIGPLSYFMVSIFGIKYIVPLIFLAGIGESTVLTSSAGVVMDRGGSSGSFYAIYSAGMPIGWGLSGLVFPYLPLNLSIVYKFIALLEVFAVSLFYIAYPGDSSKNVSLKEVISFIRESGMVLVAITIFVILAHSSLELFWSGYYFKLIDIVSGNQFLFGLIYTVLPAIMGFIARFTSGYLVDKYNPLYILASIPITLIVVSAGLNWFTGIIAIICWLVPVYGFYELATSISVSRLAPRESQATAMGAVTLMKSMGGILILMIGLLIPLSELSVFLLIFIFSIIALIPILTALNNKTISFSHKK